MSERSHDGASNRALRNALGRFATGVCILTAQARSGEPIGMTVNSFSSVSLEPPLILVSIARSCHNHAEWVAAEHFAVNVLTSDQRELSTRFARALAPKWAGLALERGTADLPLVPNTLARFQCRAEHRYEGGDHVILLGRVIALDAPRPGASPLLFFQGRYRELGEPHGGASPHHDPLWLLGW